jgi:hypothetical protein
MKLQSLPKSWIKRFIRRLIGNPADIFPFQATESERNAFAAQLQSDIARVFFSRQGRPAHKWVHYLAIYERHFAPFRNKPVRMLEIGVSYGGSLELWRTYFGPNATIFGIDIEPKCASRVDPPNQVRIGSQEDPDFLVSVINEMGPPDIILDDGSHIAAHQLTSFRTLFPLLNKGGLYAIEDTHSAYWRESGGGLGRRQTAVGLAFQIIDDMHAWYHGQPTRTPAKTEITGIHVYDSLIVIEKGDKSPPRHVYSGGDPKIAETQASSRDA